MLTAWNSRSKSGYTAKSYILDGLVAMWDGIENSGWGVHNQNASIWKDLIGNNDFGLLTSDIFLDNFARIGSSQIIKANSSYTSTEFTIEGIVRTNRFNNIGSHFGLEHVGCHAQNGNRCCLLQDGLIGYSTLKTGIFERIEIKSQYPFKQVDTDFYINGVVIDGENHWQTSFQDVGVPFIGNEFTGNEFDLFGFRIYSRILSELESSKNRLVDKARFNLP